MFFFPTLRFFVLACTDRAKVLNVSASKCVVEVQESVSLNCTAEGNPEPTYSWMQCDPQQSVCHESKLDVSKVWYDDVYICTVANSLGNNSGNVSVCKLLKNYLQLIYSTWVFLKRLSIILTAIH